MGCSVSVVVVWLLWSYVVLVLSRVTMASDVEVEIIDRGGMFVCRRIVWLCCVLW